jgi:hypothetical protein
LSITCRSRPASNAGDHKLAAPDVPRLVPCRRLLAAWPSRGMGGQPSCSETKRSCRTRASSGRCD